MKTRQLFKSNLVCVNEENKRQKEQRTRIWTDAVSRGLLCAIENREGPLDALKNRGIQRNPL